MLSKNDPHPSPRSKASVVVPNIVPPSQHPGSMTDVPSKRGPQQLAKQPQILKPTKISGNVADLA